MDRTIHQSTVTGNSLRVRRRSVATLASVAALCLFLSACSSSGSAATSSGSTSGSGGTAAGLDYAKRVVAQYRAAVTKYPSPGPALDASKVAALKGKTILFVPISLAAGPFQQQLASLKTAFGHLGINVTTCDPKFLPSAAATCLTNAKANGAAAVISSGIPYALVANAYLALEAAKIPVLVGSAGPGNPASTSDIAFQPGVTSSAKAGTVAVDETIAESGGKAHVLFVNITDSTALTAQRDAMKAEFTKNCPGCTVVMDPFNTANISHVATSVSSKLISNPSTNFLQLQADAYVPNSLSGVQSANFTNKVKAVTGTASLGVLQMVQQKRFVTADVGYDFSYIGWNEADGALRLLTGLPVNPEPFVPIRIFDAANLAGLSLTAGGIDSLYGPTSFKDMFYKNWGAA